MAEMIVVRLIGGLGNQMFEYAMAKSLAIRNKTSLVIDKSWIKDFDRKKKLTFMAWIVSILMVKKCLLIDY